MSYEQAPRSFERPVSILKIGEKTLTGAPALMAYALIYASKGSNGFVTMSELANAQRDERENPYAAHSRAKSNVERVTAFFREAGLGVEKTRLNTGRRGGTAIWISSSI